MTTLLTIIVPTYNCYSYLKDCVSQLLKIDSSVVEIIIVNDGSTDETKSFLDSITDSHFKVIHQENRGVSNARNHALEIATGEYIYFCDSDDEIIPNGFKSILQMLESKENDVFVCNFLNQTSDLKGTKTYYKRSKTGLMSGAQFLIHSLEHKEYGSEPVQYFIKRTFFNQLRFREGMLHEDDQLFPQILFRADKVFVTNKTIYLRKYRLGSLSRSDNATPRSNPDDLLYLITNFCQLMRDYNTPLSRRVFKTLKLRSWLMIFDFYNKVPEQKNLDILAKKPGILEVLFKCDVSFKYKLRYIERLFKLK